MLAPLGFVVCGGISISAEQHLLRWIQQGHFHHSLEFRHSAKRGPGHQPACAACWLASASAPALTRAFPDSTATRLPITGAAASQVRAAQGQDRPHLQWPPRRCRTRRSRPARNATSRSFNHARYERKHAHSPARCKLEDVQDAPGGPQLRHRISRDAAAFPRRGRSLSRRPLICRPPRSSSGLAAPHRRAEHALRR